MDVVARVTILALVQRRVDVSRAVKVSILGKLLDLVVEPFASFWGTRLSALRSD